MRSAWVARSTRIDAVSRFRPSSGLTRVDVRLFDAAPDGVFGVRPRAARGARALHRPGLVDAAAGDPGRHRVEVVAQGAEEVGQGLADAGAR